VALKSAWSDGTTHFLFEPVELLERLAVLTPRPRINLLVYHGVFAPHAAWRAQAVTHAAEPSPVTMPAKGGQLQSRNRTFALWAYRRTSDFWSYVDVGA
jgi:hypothetical protein